MGLDITVTGLEQIAQMAKEFPVVGMRVLNRTSGSVSVQIAREISGLYAVKQRDVKHALRTKRASVANMKSIISVAGPRLPLKLFSPKQTSEGVTILIKRGEGRKLIRHAFIAIMRSGHLGIFTREGAKVMPQHGYYAEKKIRRQPILEKFTISYPEMFSADFESLQKFAIERLVIESEHQMDYFIQTLKAQTGGNDGE